MPSREDEEDKVRENVLADCQVTLAGGGYVANLIDSKDLMRKAYVCC